MKTLLRTLIWSAVLLFAANVAMAQVSVGIRGGVNLTKWKWDVSTVDMNEFTKYLPAPYIAVPVEFQFADFFALQAEPAFIQQGVRVYEETEFEYEPGQFQTSEYDLRTRINYISLPVLLKGIIGTGPVRAFAVAGPEAGYALNGKNTTEITVSNGTFETQKKTEDIDWDEASLTRWNFSLVFGGGLEFKVGPGAILLDGRYLLGLNNLNTDDDLDSEIFNRGIGMSAGYKLIFGGAATPPPAVPFY